MTETDIRPISIERADEIGQLVYDAIHFGAPAYTEVQRRAWAPAPRSGPDWIQRLSHQDMWGAFSGETLVGLMTLEHGHYIDFAYILADWQGKGLFQRLYAQAESAARRQDAAHMKTHASLMARSAFEKVGFTVTAPETVQINGVDLDRFAMAKTL